MRREIFEGERVRVVNRYIWHYNRMGRVTGAHGGVYMVSLDGDTHDTPLWFDEIWPDNATAMAGA